MIASAEGRLLNALFEAAIRAAQPSACLPPHLPAPGSIPAPGRLIVLGAGKAAAAMAAVVEAHWPGPLEGAVVTRYGYGVPCARIQVLESSHPVPDAASVRAAERLLALAAGAGPQDQVLCLISGGASSLLCLPAPGMTLGDKQQVNQALLDSGLGIVEMNLIRRHLSAIKGGRLAAAASAAARVLTLILSDVPGDQLPDIGGGPTVADPTTAAAALAVARRAGLNLPPSAWAVLESGAAESVKPGDSRLARAEARLVATPRLALAAAAAVARAAGVTPLSLGDRIEGEAREVGRVMAGIALAAADYGEPVAAPAVLLSGGETAVTLGPNPWPGAKGGRNVEFLLALAIALGGDPRIHALAGDTDGVDGAADIAGAWIDPQVLAAAKARGIDPLIALDHHDAHGFFAGIDRQIITGPTRTNVNDFRAILIGRLTGGFP